MRAKVFIKTLNGTDTISSLLDHDEMKQETDQAGSDSVIVRIDLWASENDTSHQGELHIYHEDRWIDIGNCLIFLGRKSDIYGIGTKDPMKWQEFVRGCGIPATILPTRSQYKRIVSALGVEAALKVLSQINDVSALRLANRASNKLASFMKLP